MPSVTIDNVEHSLDNSYLEAQSTATLLSIYNAMADDSLKSWKQSKDKLVLRIQQAMGCIERQAEEAEEAEEPQAEAKPASKPKAKKAKSDKPKAPRALPKSYQMLELLVQASEQGFSCSVDLVIKELNTTKGSVASYVNYFRKGAKGHDKIDIKYDRETGYYLETKDDIAAAQAGIDARRPS